jgi:hypothetical protein
MGQMTRFIFKMLFPVLGAALICSGCATHKVQLTPHLAGWVIDPATKEPIPNATIYFEGLPDHVMLSADGGYFDFPAISKRQRVPKDQLKDLPMSQVLIIKADDHQQIEKKFEWTGIVSPTKTNIVIFLQPSINP